MANNVMGRALTTVTKAVEEIINSALAEKKIVCHSDSCVTFRVPTTVTKQKVSVFLYDVHEDLDVRLGEARESEGSTTHWKPSRIFLRFSYLITCWRTKNDEGGVELDPVATDRDSPALRIPQIVLDALLRHRTLKTIPGAFCRVLPQSENLDALGQFWQALKGNNPRLCMSYAVTVPVEIPVGAAAEPVWPVVEIDSTVSVDRPFLAAWERALETVGARYAALVSGIEAGWKMGAPRRYNKRDFLRIRDALRNDEGPFAGMLASLTVLMTSIVALARTIDPIALNDGCEQIADPQPLAERLLQSIRQLHLDMVESNTPSPTHNMADDALVAETDSKDDADCAMLLFATKLISVFKNERPRRLLLTQAERSARLRKGQHDKESMLAYLLLATCRTKSQVAVTVALVAAWLEEGEDVPTDTDG